MRQCKYPVFCHKCKKLMRLEKPKMVGLPEATLCKVITCKKCKEELK